MGENLVKKKDQKKKSLSDSTFHANSKISTKRLRVWKKWTGFFYAVMSGFTPLPTFTTAAPIS